MRWVEDFIAVDWGTTNRARYQIDASGHCVDEFEDDKGVLRYPAEASLRRSPKYASA
jgi:2-keto-3-deoxy-galactonokinase